MSDRTLEFHQAPFASRAAAEADTPLADVREAVERGRAGQGLAPGSEEVWRWRLENPGGANLGVARTDSGKIDAAVIGIRHGVLLEGERVDWIEIVDVFNDFDAGAGLARARSYLNLARGFAREFGGRAPDQTPIFFGLSTRRAHRIELACLKSEILRSESALAIAPSSVEWVAPGVEVEEVDAFTPEIDGAFARFADGRGALVVRDAERLNWRFNAHPERTYRIALARCAGELVGYAVYRRGSYAGHDGGVLADWMVRPDERDVMQGLLLWAGEAARSDGFDLLVTNVATKAPEFGMFQGVGFRVFGTDEYVTFRSFQKPYVMSWLLEHWYYTLGDTERG